MKLGDVPTNSDLPYFERIVSFNQPIGVANNGVVDIELDSMTMPFTGSLVCQVEWTVQWNNYQQVNLNPAISVPGPTVAGYFQTLDFSISACYVVHHANIYWASVAQGTLARAIVRIDVGGGGNNVTTDWLMVNWRACRT